MRARESKANVGFVTLGDAGKCARLVFRGTELLTTTALDAGYRNGFQQACIKYGLADVDLFQTTDLWDRKNIALVTQTIFAVGRATYRHPEWKGPFLGPRPSEENRREFSDEQLRAGENIIGLQAGTNRGATQSGQSFGATRKILLGK
uniref:Transgelin n=1 Tax=Phlebotomus papatasi TaxID=29031 RepID=A0A1B0DFZ6_PHLPP